MQLDTSILALWVTLSTAASIPTKGNSPTRRQDSNDQLVVMSYNLWQGGANVNDYHEKQVRFILESGADVVGLQESVDGGHATHLADALGWDVWASNQSASILSPYPIVER